MWDELGIAPCEDPKAIRRAYAARLKQLDPDADPEGFARLREAFEWALAHRVDIAQSERVASSSEELSDAELEAIGGDIEDDDFKVDDSEEDSAEDGTTAGQSTAEPARPKAPARYPGRLRAPDADQQEVRDRAVLIALDAALRRRDADDAIALYYRAAATGALSFSTAPEALERVLGIAVEDRKLDPAAFRRLARTAGLDTPRARSPFVSALQQRVLARLAAENWYDELVAAAAQRKGRAARRRAKIARYLLARIGRFWRPRVDQAALTTWLAQYHQHQGWVDDRIDPAWIAKIERRLRRQRIVAVWFYSLFIGGMLINFTTVFVIAAVKGEVSFVNVAIGLGMAVFLIWILKLLIGELMKLTFGRGG